MLGSSPTFAAHAYSYQRFFSLQSILQLKICLKIRVNLSKNSFIFHIKALLIISKSMWKSLQNDFSAERRSISACQNYSIVLYGHDITIDIILTILWLILYESYNVCVSKKHTYLPFLYMYECEFIRFWVESFIPWMSNWNNIKWQFSLIQ